MSFPLPTRLIAAFHIPLQPALPQFKARGAAIFDYDVHAAHPRLLDYVDKFINLRQRIPSVAPMDDDAPVKPPDPIGRRCHGLLNPKAVTADKTMLILQFRFSCFWVAPCFDEANATPCFVVVLCRRQCGPIVVGMAATWHFHGGWPCSHC